MKFGTLTFLTTVTFLGVLAIPVRLAAENPSYPTTTFDAPGAGTAPGSGSGTFARSINAAGAITGHYADGLAVNHGFLRAPGGEFISFDAPGAGAVAGSGSGTFPRSINAAGIITGHYNDANNVNHGFLRSPGGKLITFNAPGADTASGSGGGTFPESINDAGAIVGHYADKSGVNHGFLRSPTGEFITFAAPAAGTAPGSGGGTFPRGLNAGGAIIGTYADANNVNHGFLRSP